MARYIDADKFKSNLEKAMEKMHLIGGVKGVDVGAVIVALDRQPTADVAPRAEVEKLQIEIQALNIANEKMYSANKEIEAEVVKEIISIIEQRDESNDEHACGVKSEILSALYRGKKDAYRDIKEILEQKCGIQTNKGRCRHTICPEARQEVAREIFADIERLLSANMSGEFRGDSVEWFDYFDNHLAEDIDELKKKYTEEQ